MNADSASSADSSQENVVSRTVAVVFCLGLGVSVAAGLLLVFIQVISLVIGDGGLSVTAESVLSNASGIGASVVCVTSLIYFWARRRKVGV